MQRNFEILIDELVNDEEFRHYFLRSPSRTLELAGDWGLPLSESEVRGLIAADRSAWDRVADELGARLQEAC